MLGGMQPLDHLAHLQADSALLVAAQRDDPTAPAWEGLGWDRTRLLSHTANVHGWIRAQVRLGPSDAVDFTTLDRAPEGDGLAEWFEAGVAELGELIPTMDLQATWPTWAGPQPGTFFPRRLAQETAVHRWDAVGGPIDPELAADGIDELLELFAALIGADKLADWGTIHLHSTDADGEWLVRLGPERITFDRAHAKGDVALQGEASDLLLWSWNRVPVDERFEIFGDTSVLGRWREAVVF